MNTFSLRILAALALACCALSSCDSFNGGAADVVNPTINQQDDLDVRWGLPRRVSKSGRRSSAATSAPTTQVVAPAPGPAVNEAPPSAVSEDVKNKLR
jgi:hypothetical protein